MGEGSLSADDIDALLSGAGDIEPSAPSSGGGFDFLSPGNESPSSGGGGGPSVDDIMAALGPSSASVQSAPIAPRTVPRQQGGGSGNLNLLRDVTLTLSVEFGRTTMLIKDVLKLSEGNIVELDKNAGEDLDILVNGKVIGKGKIIIIDNYYGIRITEIVDESKRIHI